MMNFETNDSARLKREIVNVRLPEGSGDRIDKLLKGGELRSAFVRTAVLNEIRRREKTGPTELSRTEE